MSLFLSEIVTAPAHLPVTVAAADQALGAAVTEELERVVLWRGIVSQTRRITVDGPLPARIEIEPVASLTSLTRWTPADAAEVIDPTTYDSVSRDPLGTVIVPLDGTNWPAPARSVGSFEITYECGFTVTPETALLAGDAVNEVPASIQLMVNRAIAFRAGSGVGDLTIGSLTIGLADSYKTDRIPAAITSIGRAWAYRPGIIAARP